MFDILGFTAKEAQFGFLMNAFEHGALHHIGIAFGLIGNAIFLVTKVPNSISLTSLKNSGRDVIIDAPIEIDAKQKKELGLSLQ